MQALSKTSCQLQRSNAHTQHTMLALSAPSMLAFKAPFGAAPKKAAVPSFAYGLAGNYNALGG